MASFLVGNLNVVRVSRDRPTEQVTLLCEVLRAVLAEDRFAEFGDELAVISYGHEAEPTAELSQEADVRLLWGGDETVGRMRAVPIGPGGHDLTFGDRFSFAVVRPEAVLDADERVAPGAGRTALQRRVLVRPAGVRRAAPDRLGRRTGGGRRARARSSSASWRG